ncbi:hypothetical protein Sjap_025067 [Stephania japonica]|uniref:Uncharacterized protein n=1 Tax=Stephania japonica TaxID=461633 RepID=A0AAP0E149_9MAGN
MFVCLTDQKRKRVRFERKLEEERIGGKKRRKNNHQGVKRVVLGILQQDQRYGHIKLAFL